MWQGTYAVDKTGIRVRKHLLAFLRTGTEKVYRPLVQVLEVTCGSHDVGLRFAHRTQSTVEQSGIHFHTPGINHGTKQCLFLYLVMVEQYRHTHHLQRRQAYQLQVTTVTNALSHRHPDTQARVRAWSAAHGHGIQRQGMAVGKRQCLIDKHAQLHVVVGSIQILQCEKGLPIFTHGHRTGLCGGLNMQYSRHDFQFSSYKNSG